MLLCPFSLIYSVMMNNPTGGSKNKVNVCCNIPVQKHFILRVLRKLPSGEFFEYRLSMSSLRIALPCMVIFLRQCASTRGIASVVILKVEVDEYEGRTEDHFNKFARS